MTSQPLVDDVFKQLLLHIKDIQGMKGNVVPYGSEIHTNYDLEDFDHRKLAIANTLIEQAILMYYAAAGDMPVPMRIKDKQL